MSEGEGIGGSPGVGGDTSIRPGGGALAQVEEQRLRELSAQQVVSSPFTYWDVATIDVSKIVNLHGKGRGAARHAIAASYLADIGKEDGLEYEYHRFAGALYEGANSRAGRYLWKAIGGIGDIGNSFIAEFLSSEAAGILGSLAWAFLTDFNAADANIRAQQDPKEVLVDGIMDSIKRSKAFDVMVDGFIKSSGETSRETAEKWVNWELKKTFLSLAERIEKDRVFDAYAVTEDQKKEIMFDFGQAYGERYSRHILEKQISVGVEIGRNNKGGKVYSISQIEAYGEDSMRTEGKLYWRKIDKLNLFSGEDQAKLWNSVFAKAGGHIVPPSKDTLSALAFEIKPLAVEIMFNQDREIREKFTQEMQRILQTGKQADWRIRDAEISLSLNRTGDDVLIISDKEFRIREVIQNTAAIGHVAYYNLTEEELSHLIRFGEKLLGKSLAESILNDPKFATHYKYYEKEENDVQLARQREVEIEEKRRSQKSGLISDLLKQANLSEEDLIMLLIPARVEEWKKNKEQAENNGNKNDYYPKIELNETTGELILLEKNEAGKISVTNIEDVLKRKSLRELEELQNNPVLKLSELNQMAKEVYESADRIGITHDDIKRIVSEGDKTPEETKISALFGKDGLEIKEANGQFKQVGNEEMAMLEQKIIRLNNAKMMKEINDEVSNFIKNASNKNEAIAEVEDALDHASDGIKKRTGNEVKLTLSRDQSRVEGLPEFEEMLKIARELIIPERGHFRMLLVAMENIAKKDKNEIAQIIKETLGTDAPINLKTAASDLDKDILAKINLKMRQILEPHLREAMERARKTKMQPASAQNTNQTPEQTTMDQYLVEAKKYGTQIMKNSNLAEGISPLDYYKKLPKQNGQSHSP